MSNIEEGLRKEDWIWDDEEVRDINALYVLNLSSMPYGFILLFPVFIRIKRSCLVIAFGGGRNSGLVLHRNLSQR